MPSPDYRHRIQQALLHWLSRKTSDYGAQAADDIAALATATGNTRKENQDCAVAMHFDGEDTSQSFNAFIVCDGIGGMQDGGVCARIAVAAFTSALLERRSQTAMDRLLWAVRSANDEIHAIYRENGGTTLSCIFQEYKRPPLAINVGDSRIYKVTPKEVSQLTTDDNIASQMKAMSNGAIVTGQVSFGKQLTQFVGIGPELLPRELQLPEVDISGYLMTSDGIHCISQETFCEIIQHAPTPLDRVKRLSAVARWGRATDNSTALFVPLPKTEGRESSPGFDKLTLWDSFQRTEMLLEFGYYRKDRVNYPRYFPNKKGKKRGGSQVEGRQPSSPDPLHPDSLEAESKLQTTESLSPLATAAHPEDLESSNSIEPVKFIKKPRETLTFELEEDTDAKTAN